MPIILLLIYLSLIIFVLLMIQQVALPLFKDEPLFPMFNSELREQKKRIHQLKMEKKMKELKEEEEALQEELYSEVFDEVPELKKSQQNKEQQNKEQQKRSMSE